MTTVNLICSYRLCAAHQLFRPEWTLTQNNEVYGRCAQVHGHEYVVELVLAGEIDKASGMLINESQVEKIVHPFFEKNFDHRFLNADVSFFKDCPPTAEWIAVWLYSELKSLFPPAVKLQKVRVGETPTLFAEYPSPLTPFPSPPSGGEGKPERA